MSVRRELRRDDAERGADRARLADPLAVGDARVRHEPALPVPQLHGGRGQGHRDRRRRTRTSRRPATTCSSSSTRTACRRSARSSARTRPRSRATRRRRRCRSRRRPAGNVSGTVYVTANATDNDAVAGVQFKLDGADPRRRGHDRAVLDLLGHDDGAERRAHAHRGRARPGRQRDDRPPPCR